VSGGFYRALTTAHDYPLDEVASALQKAVRRSQVDEALWWAAELNVSGYGAYCWRRLMVIANEDIGLAHSQAPILVWSLYSMSVEIRKAQPGPAAEKATREWEPEALLHATWYLACAPKNRELPDAYSTITLRMRGGERIQVPDEALDNHTARGRAMGRSEGFFQREGRKVEPEAVIRDNRWGAAWQAERPAAKDEMS
jgi:replication-associated recombination protein RarA